MDIDITPWLQSLEAGIGKLPSAAIAVVLLTGPTAVWLLYRFVVQPRTSRYRAARGINAMWVCPECRSVNELRMAQCYRCDYAVDETDLHVIDPEHGAQVPFGLPMPNATTGTAVGPGRPDLGSIPGLTGFPGLDGLTGVRGVTGEARPAAKTERDAYPVGPGRPRPVRPRRAVVAGRARTGPAAPSDPPAA
jgi:hypothetical protein